MAIVSFALTTEEFNSGKKTVTRRKWKAKHLENWQRWYDEGKLRHDAYDKVPHAGGKKIGEFRLTARPYLERLMDMPESDLEAEGGMVDTKQEFYQLIGLPPATFVAVLRFEKC